MSYLHLSYSAFTLSSLGLAFHRTHLISALLCLENMMLSMYVALAMWPIQTQWGISIHHPTYPHINLFHLQSATGLALLVASTRTHGSKHLHNFNLLQC
uniref:NADH-ubiquinone oxidoreductase chain 4L n=1 Tax=Emberiza yessoensis yessoensis TaxID=505315 RepID=A0A7R6V349_9EMBE|nr:NADH dehydrogenase subunit 4L [Emberiza yessoensis yessoensis]